MMFKAIYIHTKPLKHEKKHANTNEIHQTNTMFSKFLTDVDFWQHFTKTPNLMFCMHVRMDVSGFQKNTTSFKITKKCLF